MFNQVQAVECFFCGSLPTIAKLRDQLGYGLFHTCPTPTEFKHSVIMHGDDYNKAVALWNSRQVLLKDKR